jgi:hypothetical protein
VRGAAGHQQCQHGGDLAGGEQLLTGVEQLCDSGHYSINQKHRDKEDDMANSPRWIGQRKLDEDVTRLPMADGKLLYTAVMLN